jgi:hypothetical protein
MQKLVNKLIFFNGITQPFSLQMNGLTIITTPLVNVIKVKFLAIFK